MRPRCPHLMTPWTLCLSCLLQSVAPTATPSTSWVRKHTRRSSGNALWCLEQVARWVGRTLDILPTGLDSHRFCLALPIWCTACPSAGRIRCPSQRASWKAFGVASIRQRGHQKRRITGGALGSSRKRSCWLARTRARSTAGLPLLAFTPPVAPLPPPRRARNGCSANFGAPCVCLEKFVAPKGWRSYCTEWLIYNVRRMIVRQVDYVFLCLDTDEGSDGDVWCHAMATRCFTEAVKSSHCRVWRSERLYDEWSVCHDMWM